MTTHPDDITRAAVGARLRLTRATTGLNQSEFAARANIGVTSYNQYEKGKQLPKLASAIALCDAYHLTLDWIYRGDPSGLRYEMAAAISALRDARAMDA